MGLLIKSDQKHFLSLIDFLGINHIHYLWNYEECLVLIEGIENVEKMKKIINKIQNCIVYMKEAQS